MAEVRELIAVIIVFAGSLFACKEKPVQQTLPSLTEEDQIRAAIFINQIGENGPAWPVIFLGLNDSNGILGINSDPSEELLYTLKISYPNARKYSRAHFGAKCIYEIDSSQCGIILLVCPLQRITPSQIQVVGSHHINSRAGGGRLFFLHKEAQSWIVDSSRIAWLS
jgi:hypothetical protein